MTIAEITEMQLGMHSAHVHVQLYYGCLCKGHAGVWSPLVSCHRQYPPVAKCVLLLMVKCFHNFVDVQLCQVLQKANVYASCQGNNIIFWFIQLKYFQLSVLKSTQNHIFKAGKYHMIHIICYFELSSFELMRLYCMWMFTEFCKMC